MLTLVNVNTLREMRRHLYAQEDASLHKFWAPIINDLLWSEGFPPQPIPRMCDREWIQAWYGK